MNIYTCTTFKGHWPVGTSAIIVAEDMLEAHKLLGEELVRIGLPPCTEDDEFEILDLTQKKAIILQDGDY